VGAILLHKPIETQVRHETITMLFSL